jgi:hypothetical protein
VQRRTSNLAEFTFSAFRGVERHDMISNFDIGNTFANRFNDSATFVATDYWESAFRVFSRKGIGIRMTDLQPFSTWAQV